MRKWWSSSNNGKQRRPLLSITGIALGVLILFLASTLVLGLINLYRSGAGKQYAPFDEIKQQYTASDAALLDRHNEVIHGLRVEAHGRRLEWIPLGDMSPAMVQATLRVEDRRFYGHSGIDWLALATATYDNFSHNSRRGASTITMQLVSTLDKGLKPRIGNRRGLVQKWKQMKAAVSLEKQWTKEQILEAYLNLISFRGELEGICAASRGLFDKDPSGLTKAESFLLASLITSPNAPLEKVVNRACRVGLSVSCDDIKDVAYKTLTRPYQIRREVSIAAHVARILLVNGKKEVRCTLDGNLQRYVYAALSESIRLLEKQNVFDGAALVVENKTGDILAYVGNSATSPATLYVDGITAYRQAGSTLKPFLYELAFENKLLTAASILDDSPLQIATPTGLYVPQNYDNMFRGSVSARTALSSSMNIPAVRALVLVGVADFVERLRELGFTSIFREPEYYGYSIALGSADITLYELVNAYRTLANDGRLSNMRLTFEQNKSATTNVLDKKAAFLVSHILSDRQARSTTFGLENPLSTRFWTAVKTGTSKDMRDNWCVGYSDSYTVGVWVGNFSGEPMRNVTGVAGAAPVWLEIMNYLHREKTSKPPQVPTGVLSAQLSFQDSIEPQRVEWFIKGTEPVTMVTLNTIHAKPRITYPTQETLIAIDPEIPESLQRVPLRFEPQSHRFEWMLNKEKIGVNEPVYLWMPKRGTHELAISDDEGRVLDSVRFLVR
jgi:penicillin-binding protein 1C